MKIYTFPSLRGLQSWEYMSSCERSKCKPGMCGCQLYPALRGQAFRHPIALGTTTYVRTIEGTSVQHKFTKCTDHCVATGGQDSWGPESHSQWLYKLTAQLWTQFSEQYKKFQRTAHSKLQEQTRFHGLFLTFKNWFNNKANEHSFIKQPANQWMPA